MQTELFTCPVCYEPFDHSQHVPKVLPRCGHTLCGICLEKILRKMFPECPLDKIKIKRKLESIPVNFTVKQAIPANLSQKIFCEQHPQEKLSFLCLNDKSKICYVCLEEHQEKGHQFKSFTKIKEMGAKYEASSKDLLTNLGSYCNKTKDIIDQSCNILSDTLKQKFQKMRDLIQRKETELNLELYCFKSRKKRKVEGLIGNDSEIVKNFSKISADMANIIDKEEYLMKLDSLSNIDQEIKNWNTILSSRTIHQKINEEFSKINKSIQDCIMQQQDSFAKLAFPTSDPLESLISTFPLAETANSSKDNLQDSDIEVSTRLVFEFETNCLKITNLEEPNDQIIRTKEWAKLEQIELMLFVQLASKDLELLKYFFETKKEL